MKILSIRSHRAFSFFLTVLAFLCVLCGKTAAQDFKTVHDGVEYAEVTREISGLQVKMNLLRLDLTKVRLDVHHAMDAAIGTEKTSSIATRHGAVAAINAGFFRLDNSIFAGDASALLRIDGKLLSENRDGRVSLGIINGTKKTDTCFARVQSFLFIVLGNKDIADVAGINRERKANEIVIYTPEFGTSTMTTMDGSEFIVRATKNSRAGKVLEIRRGAGNSLIPSNGFVVSIAGTGFDQLKIKEKSTVTWGHGPEALGQCRDFFIKAEDVIAGVPQLIKDGKIDITWEQEKASKSFVETRHPRTAVAKLQNGKFLMITVDGRSESSGGIGLQGLAEYLLSLGAVDAMNLDGGGSTTMFLDGKVVNHPSDKEGERKVSDAILVTLRKKK